MVIKLLLGNIKELNNLDNRILVPSKSKNSAIITDALHTLAHPSGMLYISKYSTFQFFTNNQNQAKNIPHQKILWNCINFIQNQLIN